MLKVLHHLPPELAHRVAVRLLQIYGAMPVLSSDHSKKDISCFGLSFTHRLGVAAGLDKNAVAYKGLMRMGFSFVEVGTVTPLPQLGSPLPRLFRLLEDGAVINRMGFNNRGIEALVQRVQRDSPQRSAVLGINIGPNKDAPDPLQDYIACFRRALPYADYFTINLSSPNTPGLRALQRGAGMRRLLQQIHAARQALAEETSLYPPMLIKVAPDWDCDDDFYRLLDAGVAEGFDGFIVSNTTVSRPESVQSPYRQEIGGLSGAPLFALSTMYLARAYRHLGGAVPLVGVGGISSQSDAILKLRAGASLLQVYSGLTISPKNIVSIFGRKYGNPRDEALFRSEVGEDMIGCDAGNLDQEEKLRLLTLSQND